MRTLVTILAATAPFAGARPLPNSRGTTTDLSADALVGSLSNPPTTQARLAEYQISPTAQQERGFALNAEFVDNLSKGKK